MFNFFKTKKEDHKAHINDTQYTLTVKRGDNLLKSALESNIPWPHDCRVGSCTTCKCRLVEGKIKPLSDFSYVLEKEELENGCILACQSALKTDIKVEVVLDEKSGIGHWESVGTIKKIKDLTHDIKEVIIEAGVNDLPKENFLYKSGQYASLKIPSLEDARSYSFANAPSSNQKEFAFYIRHVPNGEFTDWLFEQDRTGEKLEISGPYGNFGLVEGQSTMNFVAGGSGMSAVISILQDALQSKVKRNVRFLFGARKQEDLYCKELIDEIIANWEDQGLGKFEYIPCLSEELDKSSWQGARGLCVDFIIQDSKQDLSKQQAYLCGPPAMIDAGIDIFKDSGMGEEAIFFDKFLDSSTMLNGR